MSAARFILWNMASREQRATVLHVCGYDDDVFLPLDLPLDLCLQMENYMGQCIEHHVTLHLESIRFFYVSISRDEHMKLPSFKTTRNM